MLSDERQAMREEMLREQHHEHNMATDVEYFCEYTLDNFYIFTEGKSYIHLYDMIKKLKEHCNSYGQSFEELYKYMEEL